jgi:hypothetical protein
VSIILRLLDGCYLCYLVFCENLSLAVDVVQYDILLSAFRVGGCCPVLCIACNIKVNGYCPVFSYALNLKVSDIV